MNKKYLTPEQNTCAARIFLNAFGLTLDNVSGIDEFSNVKIFDRDINEVGKLYFDNGKVIMIVNYKECVLEASFDIAEIIGFVDPECKNGPFALFGQWFSKIIFQIKNPNNIKFSGEFLLDCSADTEFGLSCICHPLIKCDVDNKGTIILKLLRNGRSFGLEVTSERYNETIDIMPWDEMNGFIKHVISSGEYDSKKYEHEYRKYMGVFPAGNKCEDKLRLFLSETEWDKQISFINDFIEKAGDDNSKDLVIQKGLLMQSLDPEMFIKIKKAREIFLFADISLLDNLISICYDRYTDEEINALLDLNRQRMNYQNGANSLVESYYGIGISNCFFPLEIQKRLMKK